jgi:hypothetical protein
MKDGVHDITACLMIIIFTKIHKNSAVFVNKDSQLVVNKRLPVNKSNLFHIWVKNTEGTQQHFLSLILLQFKLQTVSFLQGFQNADTRYKIFISTIKYSSTVKKKYNFKLENFSTQY